MICERCHIWHLVIVLLVFTEIIYVYHEYLKIKKESVNGEISRNITNANFGERDISANITTTKDICLNYTHAKFEFTINKGIWATCNWLKKQKHPWLPRRNDNNIPSSIKIVYYHRNCANHRIGNFLSEYFINRIISAYAGVDFNFSCFEQTNESVWIDLGVPIPFSIPYNDPNTWINVCDNCMYNEYSNDKFPHSCREMSGMTSLIPVMKKEFEVLTSKVFQRHPELREEIDEIAIHVRFAKAFGMGITPFRAYLDIISTKVSSIGIISKPTSNRKECLILDGMKDFLKKNYPNTQVTVRNSTSDTIPIAFTRLIKARQMTICTTSTFCLWPTLSAEGIRVLLPSHLYGVKHPNWVDKLDLEFEGTIVVPKVKYFPSLNWPSDEKKLLDILSHMSKEVYGVLSLDELDVW